MDINTAFDKWVVAQQWVVTPPQWVVAPEPKKPPKYGHGGPGNNRPSAHDADKVRIVVQFMSDYIDDCRNGYREYGKVSIDKVFDNVLSKRGVEMRHMMIALKLHKPATYEVFGPKSLKKYGL
jgi:hypothetical protein